MFAFARVIFVLETSVKIRFPSLSCKNLYFTKNFNLIYIVKILCINITPYMYFKCVLCILVYFLSVLPLKCIFVCILKQWTNWNKLEPPEMRGNELEPPKTSWNKMELVKNDTWKSDGSWLQRLVGGKGALTWLFKKKIYSLNLLPKMK